MRGSDEETGDVPFRVGDRVRLRRRPELAAGSAQGTVTGCHETPRGMIFVTVRIDPPQPAADAEEIVVSPSEIELLPRPERTEP